LKEFDGRRLPNASQKLRGGVKGLRQFVDLDRQRAWLEGSVELTEAGERNESIEHRLKYAHRFQKLLRRPQGPELFDILALYGRRCLPIPRTTERYYWSVSCLPSTSDKPLVRVNASWMELFTLYGVGDGLRARFILHLSDFRRDRSIDPAEVDRPALDRCVRRSEDLTYSCPQGSDIFVVKVQGADSIREFLTAPNALRAIRHFNLTHMNRGRNAYQTSHSYSVADYMLGEGVD